MKCQNGGEVAHRQGLLDKRGMRNAGWPAYELVMGKQAPVCAKEGEWRLMEEV